MYRDKKLEAVEVFVKNAKYIARTSGIGIKQLEKYCGVAAGYFSRRVIDRPKRQSSIPLQTALLVCECLDRPIEELLNPKLRFELEAKRLQEQQELLEQKKLSLTGE